MAIKKEKRGAAGVSDHNRQIGAPEIIVQKSILFPVDFLPRHISERLIKIAAFRGIPAHILVESEITKLVLRNWNSTENRPVKENRDEFI